MLFVLFYLLLVKLFFKFRFNLTCINWCFSFIQTDVVFWLQLRRLSVFQPHLLLQSLNLFLILLFIPLKCINLLLELLLGDIQLLNFFLERFFGFVELFYLFRIYNQSLFVIWNAKSQFLNAFIFFLQIWLQFFEFVFKFVWGFLKLI